MLKRGNLQNTIEKAKPNMQLINVIPLIHKVFLFLFQQLCHVVNQRIDKTNHEYKVNFNFNFTEIVKYTSRYIQQRKQETSLLYC